MFRRFPIVVAVIAAIMLAGRPNAVRGDDPPPVSYSRDVRPLLAAACFGCHQGAKTSGGYVMTDFRSFVAGGDSGQAAIEPGEPESSYLIEMITPVDGDAAMPPDASPLADENIELVRRWIAGGAINDETLDRVNYSLANPPRYSRQPYVTSLDFSPDGQWLAVSGFHEVILLAALPDTSPESPESADSHESPNRLIGMSARIESIRFSPDGSRLAVGGGNPAEFGEVQVWNVASRELELSKIVSHDTVTGLDWSPDGRLVSFGCKDNSVRAIDSTTGEQVLFQGAHEDWVRDTVFSVDGSRLVSVGRDMSCKLTEIATGRFIDNLTSITPGVLKGGIASVARHPVRDEIVIGGADGVTRVYRMDRITKRVIGDDANLVRLFPALPGRIQSVVVSRDGKRIAVASSLDGHGVVEVFSYEFDPTVSEELKAILAKLPESWTDEERKQVNAYNTADVRRISSTPIDDSGIYSVAFAPDGEHLACGGTDGAVRIVETETGKIVAERNPVTAEAVAALPPDPLTPKQEAVGPGHSPNWYFSMPEQPSNSNAAVPREAAPDGPPDVRGLTVLPTIIHFTGPADYAQLVITATLGDGLTLDVTDQALIECDASMLRVDGSLVQPVSGGKTELVVRAGNQVTTIPVTIYLPDAPFVPDFRRDVNPVLTRLGCNGGTCHGSAGGKQGFKLSLRGYDPLFDVRALSDDMAARRVNLAWPDDSLMLRKAIAAVPHTGGQLIKPNSRYHWLVRQWIAGGAVLDADDGLEGHHTADDGLEGNRTADDGHRTAARRVAGIEVFPANPVLADAGASQQLRIEATYSDGSRRDVTREAILEIGNLEIAAVEHSTVTALRRGESPVLARYDGAYAATTLTVMGQRGDFVWKEPESWTEIDRLVARKWERMKLAPSELCTDAEFIRRVYLDLAGLPPDADTTTKFLSDSRPTRLKRDELIDSLIGTDAFVEHWSNKWADLLQVNGKYLGSDGARAFRDWIREQVRDNRPLDKMAFEILTASGSNRTNPAASYFKIHRTPADTMETTTHLFLGTRFNCNKCHDHPFERWTQDQYFQTAAYFAEVSLERDPEGGDETLGGSAVEGAQPVYEIVADNGSGQMTHDRTGENVEPQFPFDCLFEAGPNASRRERLAAWITSPDNPYFATSYVNRLWGYLVGTGLIEPLDDIRAGNPPTNAALLEFLRDEFLKSGFDTRHVIGLICKSRVYQLSVRTHEFNSDDSINYSHARARRLPAEVLFDAIHFVTGSPLKIPGVPEGTRAAALPDAGVNLPSGFLATLGRPARESVCECERSSELQLGSVLALVSGPDVSAAINDPDNALAHLVRDESDDRRLVEQVYLRILNRLATEAEVNLALEEFATLAADHQRLVEQRDEQQQLVDRQLPELRQQRDQAITETTEALDAAIKNLDPELLTKEAAREQAAAEAQAALTQYEGTGKGLEAWLQRQVTYIHWHPLAISSFHSETGRTAAIQSDRSGLVSGNSGRDRYTITSATDLTGISAVRLELLPDESLSQRGPGLAENGNLVLTEIQVEVADPRAPDQWLPVEIASATASFEQPGFPVSGAIDGQIDGAAGWAVMGNQGRDSWATFQLKLPTGFSGGTLIRFRLHQQYDETHQIGRLRISLTTSSEPNGLGLSESLLAELSRPIEQRNDETAAALEGAFRKSDPHYAVLQETLAMASQPLAIDASIVALREKLARISQPIPPDARLTRLIEDVAMSTAQLSNARLTATQDLAWALINSPAFLFNH